MHKDHEDKPFTLEVNRRSHACNLTEEDLGPFFYKGIRILKQKNKDLAKKMHGGVLKVFFVGDEEIQKINQNFRDVDKPTDVIALSYFEDSPFPGEDMIGEIFISVDTTHKQAKEHGVAVEDEATFLFVHGLLHIFGFDHENDSEREKMFSLQDDIIGHKNWRTMSDYK